MFRYWKETLLILVIGSIIGIVIYFATRSNGGGGDGKKCPNNCSNNGSCTNGICNCIKNYCGKDCSVSCSSTNIFIFSPKTVKVQPTDWKIDPKTLAGKITDMSPANIQKEFPNISDRYSKTYNLLGKEDFSKLGSFVKSVLNWDSPFSEYGNKFPYINFNNDMRSGGYIALTQRHLAFICANTLFGNTLSMTNNSLSKVAADCTNTDQLFSWLSFLLVLSQELISGDFGTLVIMSRGVLTDDAFTALRNKAGQLINVNVTRYRESDTSPDFMSMGKPGQSLVDISGGNIGGGGEFCHVSNTQDETLMMFYPEVVFGIIFSEYISGSAPTEPKIAQPALWLGVRRYVDLSTGELRDHIATCGRMTKPNTGNMVKTTTMGLNKQPIYKSSFAGFQSSGTSCHNLELAIMNLCADQRNIGNLQNKGFLYNIKQCATMFSHSSYPDELGEVLGNVIQSVGTGPWGSGVWWGNSQMSFISMWVGISIAGNLDLDYYLYDAFCENPGNQCYLLGKDDCLECLKSHYIGVKNLDDANKQCGNGPSLSNILSMYKNDQVNSLYQKVMDNVKPCTEPCTVSVFSQIKNK